MVEANAPNLQIPIPEESKDELIAMSGDSAGMSADIRRRLTTDVELNPLESGLLEHYMRDKKTLAQNVDSLLTKLRVRLSDDGGAIKKIKKVQPLFKEHEFWNSQPVPNYYDFKPQSAYNKPIEQKQVSEIQTDPLHLPEGYDWQTLDLSNDEQAEEVYQLLTNHYVEDSDGKFRFDYSIPFLRWALNPPGQPAEWVIGVRGGDKLVGFITAIKVNMIVGGQSMEMAEVNFLCVHKKIRDKRLTPMLIREITRRVNLRNIWQAIYTSGTVLPTPITTAQYSLRNVNPQKLVDIKFSSRPANVSQAKFNREHALPKETMTKNLTEMTEADIPAVTIALNRHLQENYKVHIVFNEEEVHHFLLPRESVVYSWVVKNDQGEVTDFVSFYALNTSVLDNPNHSKIYAAYGYYNFAQDNNKPRFIQLMRDSLILANEREFDVYNITEVLKHNMLAKELRFKVGDGKLNHYLYNFLTQSVDSSEIGIVLV